MRTADKFLPDIGIVGEDRNVFHRDVLFCGKIFKIHVLIFYIVRICRAHAEKIFKTLARKIVYRRNGRQFGDFILLAYLCGNGGNRRLMAAEYGLYVILSYQTFGNRAADFRIALRVSADNFQLFTVNSALCIDHFHCKVNAAHNIISDGSLIAGKRIHRTDFDRVSAGCAVCVVRSECRYRTHRRSGDEYAENNFFHSIPPDNKALNFTGNQIPRYAFFT